MNPYIGQRQITHFVYNKCVTFVNILVFFTDTMFYDVNIMLETEKTADETNTAILMAI